VNGNSSSTRAPGLIGVSASTWRCRAQREQLRGQTRDEQGGDEHRHAEARGEIAPRDVAKADAIHHHEPGASLAQRGRGAAEGGRIVLFVRGERRHRGVEAVGAPARGGLSHVALRRRQHPESAGMREAAQHAEQNLVGFQQRPSRGHAREGAGAEQHGQRDALILERGDPRLHPRQHARLADEDRGAIREPRDEDLVVAFRRQ